MRDLKAGAQANDLVDIRDIVAAMFAADVLLVDGKFHAYLTSLSKENPLPAKVFTKQRGIRELLKCVRPPQ